MTHYPTAHLNPQGAVLEVLGSMEDAEVQTRLVILKFGIRDEFPSEVLAEAAEADFNLRARGGVLSREDLARYFHDLSDVDPLLFVRMLASASQHDALDHLPHVDVPTLVVAGERDTFTPMWLSVKMHSAIPDSELWRIHRTRRERLAAERAATDAKIATVAQLNQPAPSAPFPGPSNGTDVPSASVSP